MPVEPVPGLNVVLRLCGSRAAGRTAAKWWNAQTLEEIVGRSVLLENHNDVSEV